MPLPILEAPSAPGSTLESHSPLEPSGGRTPLPPSVDIHLWEPCNMRCRFCFATFQDVRAELLPRGHLPRQEALLRER